MSVALGRIFNTAMSGRSKERQELAESSIPLSAHLPVVAARGGADLVRRLFEPLGYEVTMAGTKLDDSFLDWGDSPYVSLTIACVWQDLLAHLWQLTLAHLWQFAGKPVGWRCAGHRAEA
jgi:hypothetical protein